MRPILLMLALAVTGCTSSHWAGPQTPELYYAKLSPSEKKIFDQGYIAKTSDEAGRINEAYERMQSRSLPGATDRHRSALVSKLVTVPVPRYTDENGVSHDASTKYVTLQTKE
jgi:hypothetical protein